MAIRLGVGPVFVAECVTGSRKRQLYAGRAWLVGLILLGLMIVWATKFRGRAISFQAMAEVGTAFFQVVLIVQFALGFLVVPAVTAGAICQEKARGSLILWMATDLSDAEIVLGKLAARLATVLGVVACALPVLAICLSLGGVDPRDVLGGTLVILGLVVLGAALTLTFSVWASKAHEALIATYAVWAVWLLILLVWSEMRGPGPVGLLHYSNPVWLLFGDRQPQGADSLFWRSCFGVGCLALAVGLCLVSIARLRPVVLRQASRTVARRVRPTPFDRLYRALGLKGVSLDDDPVLWREWRRGTGSAWSRTVWSLYTLFCLAFAWLVFFPRSGIGPGVVGFQVAIGLLLVSVGSTTALAEERARGDLDVLLASPLSTREIVLGKWWGVFASVPRMAIIPSLIVFGQMYGWWRWPAALILALAVMALVMAYGAAITSLGLALAAWQPRVGRAMGIGVALYFVATIGWPIVALSVFRSGPDDGFFLWLSPFFGSYMATARVAWVGHTFDSAILPTLLWAGLIGAAAYGLLCWTIASFDRLLGRVPEAPGASIRHDRGPAATRRSALEVVGDVDDPATRGEGIPAPLCTRPQV